MLNEPTAGPWIAWRLAPDSDERERCIITTADGETEVCGIVHNQADAPVLAAAPEMLEVLEKVVEYEGCFCQNGMQCSPCDVRAVIAKAKGETNE